MAKVKIYNQTKNPTIPNELLEPLALTAARFMKADIKNVPVVFKWSQCQMGGEAIQRRDLDERELLGKRIPTGYDYKPVKIKWVKANGGIIIMRIPRDSFRRYINPDWKHCYNQNQLLSSVQHIWEILVHEWCHIMDFQERKRFPSGYGQKHDNREVEQAVYNRIYDMHDIAAEGFDWHEQKRLPKRAQEAILNLAVWIEDNLKPV